MTASELRETLQEKLPAIETPPGDLGRCDPPWVSGCVGGVVP